MLRLVALRLLDSIPTILLALTLVFVALRMLPGDPALAALGDYASPQQLAEFREKMGLNAPLWQQYLDFVRNALVFDFGISLYSGYPVTELVMFHLPYTIELTIASILLGVVISIPLGVAAATNRGKAIDSGSRFFALLGSAVPDFYLGAIILIAFALNLGWFPVSGGGEEFWDRMHRLVLPAITLALIKSAFLSRLTRSALLEVLQRDFIRTARAKGASERRVIYRHGMRNALLPITTGIGLSSLATLSGSVAVELIFNRPGLGNMLITAIEQRDYPVMQAGIVLFTLIVILFNLLLDILYVVLDPRVQVKS